MRESAGRKAELADYEETVIIPRAGNTRPSLFPSGILAHVAPLRVFLNLERYTPFRRSRENYGARNVLIAPSRRNAFFFFNVSPRHEAQRLVKERRAPSFRASVFSIVKMAVNHTKSTRAC